MKFFLVIAFYASVLWFIAERNTEDPSPHPDPSATTRVENVQRYSTDWRVNKRDFQETNNPPEVTEKKKEEQQSRDVERTGALVALMDAVRRLPEGTERERTQLEIELHLKHQKLWGPGKKTALYEVQKSSENRKRDQRLELEIKNLTARLKQLEDEMNHTAAHLRGEIQMLPTGAELESKKAESEALEKEIEEAKKRARV